jgi:phosphate ABC transporter phosphate-binding protein
MVGVWLLLAGTASAKTILVPISGAGSTWVSNALDQWIRNIAQDGIQVNYAATGSSDGRNEFRNGTVDFGASEIPYGLHDAFTGSDPLPARPFAYIPDVAGGTTFMYNLHFGGHQIRNLRLDGKTLAEIFTGVISEWNNPAIKQDNPNLQLPAERIVPVVRSDGSGTTAQFTLWMSHMHPAVWDAYCAKFSIKAPCGLTSVYPVVPGSDMIALSGSLGVAGYVAQSTSEGAITYVEYSYTLETGYPAVALENTAGYYTLPTADNVAVSLLKAQINYDQKSTAYLTQNLSNVYSDPDPRTYEMSSYSYMIIPTSIEDGFSSDKGYTLGKFVYYMLCQGQQEAPILGYSPLPINLAEAGFAQVRKIPGVDVETINIRGCDNPTFSTSGKNTLAVDAPFPPACAKAGPTQCSATQMTANMVTARTRVPTTTTIPKKAAITTTTTGPKKAGGRNTTTTAVLASTTAVLASSTAVLGSTTTVPLPSWALTTTTTVPGSTTTVPIAAESVIVGNDLSAGSDLPYGLASLVVLGAIVVGPPLLYRALHMRGRR